MEHLYIVIYRFSQADRWRPQMDGIFDRRDLADAYRAVLLDLNPNWEYIVMEALMVTPKEL